MGDLKKAKHQNRHVKPKKAELTPEQQAEVNAAFAKAEADAKAEAERIHLYGASVQKMSHRNLVSELKGVIRREYAGRPPEPQAGLTIAFGTVLLTVLENTKTPSAVFETNEDGTPKRVGRLDQINQLGHLSHYLR
jgi:hypothetical protein